MYYSVCWCTLAGSAACKTCSNNPNREINALFPINNDYVNVKEWYKTYDSDRYELVEKKDWKIKQLKADIERFKEDLEQNKKDVETLKETKAKLIEAIAYAEKELKELEK